MEYHFYNLYHYGDNILNLKFLRNLPLIEKQIIIHYYYNQHYIKNARELEEYVVPGIVLHDASAIPSHSIHLWMGNNEIAPGFHYDMFDVYYENFYKYILTTLRLSTIQPSLYHDDPRLLERYHTLPDKYKEIDILIINAPPASGQFTYKKEEWDELCKYLHTKFKIATAQHVSDDIACTMRDSMTIHDIAAISTHAKYIIAAHSGPIAGCYNSYTKQSVKKWFVFHNTTEHRQLDVVDKCTLYQVTMFFVYLD